MPTNTETHYSYRTPSGENVVSKNSIKNYVIVPLYCFTSKIRKNFIFFFGISSSIKQKIFSGKNPIEKKEMKEYV